MQSLIFYHLPTLVLFLSTSLAVSCCTRCVSSGDRSLDTLSSHRSHCAKLKNNVQNPLYCIVFIHFYSASHGKSLSEALLTTEIDTVRVYTTKRYRQLQVKDLPKIPMWRLERDSNPQPSGRKALSLPMRHNALTTCQDIFLFPPPGLLCDPVVSPANRPSAGGLPPARESYIVSLFILHRSACSSRPSLTHLIR